MKFESNWEESCFSFYIKEKVKKEGLDKCHLQEKKDYLVSKKQIQRWQGWPNGESIRPPPMWPGFDFRTRCHMLIEFVGSLLCYERFFLGYSGFPLSPKTDI